ncbi:hypothetical protein ACFWJE_24215 [Streptomyces griseoincarnatus]
MRIQIMSQGDEETLEDLRHWLGREPETGHLSIEPITKSGTTMSALDALEIILSTGMDIASFSLAYVTWRSAKANGLNGDGGRTLTHADVTVDIGDLSVEELADLLRRLQSDDATEETPE